MKLVLLLGAVLLTACTPVEEAIPGDSALSYIAEHTEHGFDDANLTWEAMEARLDRGETISIACGHVSMLGVRKMKELGIKARRVSTRGFGTEPGNEGASHTLMEVWRNDHWELYDLDLNRRPVYSDGRGMSLQEFSDVRKTGEFRYEILADDTGISDGEVERFYDAAIGVIVAEEPI